MSQPSVFYTSPSTVKNVNNHNGYRSKVRETARKFDMMGKSNHSAPSPAPSHHSSVAIQITEKHERSISSSSSSSDSITDEYVISERKKSTSAEKTTPDLPTETVLLTKPHISTARIEIRPPTQQKPTPSARRTLPPIPQNRPESKEDDEPTYINNGNNFEENRFVNGHNNFHEVDDENEFHETDSFPSYTKPMIHRKDTANSSSSVQTNHYHTSKLRSNSYRNGIEKSSSTPVQNRYKNSDADSIGLDIVESSPRFQRTVTISNGYPDDHRIASFSSNYETTEAPERAQTLPHSSRHSSPPPPPPRPPPPAFAKPFLQQQTNQDELQSYTSKRSLPLSNFMIELDALLVIFIVCMILALAVRENETTLRTIMHIVFSYIYLVSIIWMIWCTFDIIKFRRQWADITASAHDHDEYMDMTERHSHKMFYFPDIHNTGGLFMRIGAGLLCMGGLILTVIGIAIIITKLGKEEPNSRASSSGATNPSTLTTQLIAYILRFIFHCVQYSFLFRYGNLVINRYHLVAKLGLIHLVIANFCTWFEAIVIETLEQIHKKPDIQPTTPTTTTDPMNVTYPTTFTTTTTTTINDTLFDDSQFYFTKILAAAEPDSLTGNNKTTLETLNQLELSMADYLYPCLIEYSLIAVTVFFIMWKNVGKDEKRSFLRFGDRHVFTINCARASRGLLIGGIILLLTVVILIPIYLFEEYSTSITQLTGLVLLVVSLLTVCLSYFHTTKLYYDRHAHVDKFDQVLILITTVGDFAYSFFGLFASIFLLESQNKLPVGTEISIGFLAIFQTFLQTGFILDTLKRRTTTKQEHRNKPGRETITALLLMNLAIWIHDSLSAKKIKLNPSQMVYYNADTWAIIQAFSSPLSIFYRFHSSVCLADIWQEVYHDDGTRSKEQNRMIPLVNMNSGHDN